MKKSNKNVYINDGPRNLGKNGAWNENFNDYGKSGISNYPNERDNTQDKTIISNLVSFVKSIISPLEDLPKITKKQNVIGNIRSAGNFSAQMPSKITVMDPNDIARTTIKETNIHNNRSGNFNGPTKLTIYDPNDIARTTIKETNIHDVRTGNMDGGRQSQLPAYDPNDVARTTIKETNIHDVRTGNMDGGRQSQLPAYDPNDVARTTIKETNIHDVRTGNMDGGRQSQLPAYDPNDVARTTIKETNIHNNRSGNFNGPTKLTIYDPNDIARTTIKETNIHDVRTGNMDGGRQSQLPAYDPNDIARTTIKETNIHDNRTGNLNINGGKGQYRDQDINAKTTVRETLDSEETNLNIQGPIKNIIYDPNDIAKTTIKETNIDNNHTGNIGGLEEGGAYLTNEYKAPNTNKQFTSDIEYTGGISKSDGIGYLTNPKNAPNTNKQFTSDIEYTGVADSANEKPKSYDKFYNASLNESKQKISVGRVPTKNSVKLAVGESNINMEVKKLQSDVINIRDNFADTTFNLNRNIPECSITKDKISLSNNIILDRVNPDILSAFKKSIYTVII